MVETDFVELSPYESARLQRNEAKARVKTLEAKIAELQAISYVERLVREDGEVDEAARALLDGADRPSSVGTVEYQIRNLQNDLVVAARALQIAGGRFSEEKEKHAVAMANELAPRHRAVVARIAKALRELADANDEERDIRAELPGGYFLLLPKANFPNIGHPDRNDSPAWYFFQHLRRHHLLDDEAAIADAAD